MPFRLLEEEEPIDPEASLGTVLATSVVLGVVHVVTGPDHISALIALAASGGWRSFFLGIRWGVGHTSGLVLIAAIFFALNGRFDLAAVGHYGERAVGFFMIGLGVWAGWGSVRTFRRAKGGALPTADEALPLQSEADADSEKQAMLESSMYAQPEQPAQDPAAPADGARGGRVLCSPSLCGVRCVCRAQGALALSAGLVHGVAGPGQILGVLPAVIIMTGGEVDGSTENAGHAWMAVVYLTVFGASSTLTMGLFAALYGEATTWCGDARCVNLAVGLFSASFSILVGVVWLWFLLQGQEIDLSGVPLFG